MFILQVFDCGAQGLLLRFVQVTGQQGRFAAKGTPHGLPRNNGADTANRFAQSRSHRQVFFAGSGHHGGGAGCQKIRLIGFGRQRIRQSGQQLADLAVLKIHALEGIDDLAALDQHQVGVTAHQLGSQGIGYQVAHLIGAQKVKKHNAVAGFHMQPCQTAAGQVFAQQHAKARRGERVFKAFFGQADTRRAAAGRQQQLERLGASAQGHQHFIPRRLKNFINFGIQQGAVQFICDQRKGRGIQCHGGTPFLLGQGFMKTTAFFSRGRMGSSHPIVFSRRRGYR